VANEELPRPAQVTRDLLGAPLPAQQLLDPGEVRRAEPPVAAGAGAPAVRPLLCGEGAVAAVGAGAVTADLAADGTPVAGPAAGVLTPVK